MSESTCRYCGRGIVRNFGEDWVVPLNPTEAVKKCSESPDGKHEPSPELGAAPGEVKPTIDTDVIAEIELVRGWFEGHPDSAIIEELAARSVKARSELAQLRARVAVLDAQEAALPELPAEAADDTLDGWYELAYEARCAQLLDALRAVQAKNGVIGNLAEGIVEEYSPCVIDESRPRLEWCVTHQTKRCGQKALYEKAVAAIAAYDALAGKDGE